MVFCTSCLEIFIDNFILKVQGSCPKVGCKGVLMEVDEMLAPAVILLYKKGYRYIVDCCSGHAHRSDSILYISFNDNALIDDCPKEWEIVNSGEQITICKHIETTELFKKQLEIFKALVSLYNWAKNLDDCQ